MYRYVEDQTLCNLPPNDDQMAHMINTTQKLGTKPCVAVSNDGIIYQDWFTHDYLLTTLFDYLLNKDYPRGLTNILKIQKILVGPEALDDSATDYQQRLRVIQVFSQPMPEPLFMSPIDFKQHGIKLFNVIQTVNSLLDRLASYGGFVHGTLTLHNIRYDKIHGVQVHDFATAAFKFSIDNKTYLMLPEIPQMLTQGDCPYLRLENRNGYYKFYDPDEYLLAAKRGYIGRLAFSEQQSFDSIDRYMFIISLLFDQGYREVFFQDEACLKYWQTLWINKEYAQTVKDELMNVRPPLRTAGNYPLLESKICDFLKLRPLKTLAEISRT